MVFARKFKVWLISLALVFGVFAIYVVTSDTGNTRVDKTDIGLSDADSNALMADANTGQIGDAKLQYLSQARFETVDEKTRKLKRVVGFEKVLHTSGNEWDLEKPFMNIYEGKLSCDITADNGTIEVENVKGAQPSPKNALLKGNVVIHILPEGKTSAEDSFIYLDEVKFDGDRSMFLSDSEILFQSKDAELKGKGLEVVYNGVTSRLEYLEIKKVYYLHIKKELSEMSSNNGGDDVASAQTSVNDPLPSQDKNPSESSPLADGGGQVVENQDAEPEPESEQKPAVAKKAEGDNYQCIFQNDVILEYEDSQVVLAEELIISNLLWGSDEEDEPKDEEPADNAQQGGSDVKTASANSTDPAQQSEPKVVDEPADSAVATVAAESKVIVVVTCKGPMVVKPIRVQGDPFTPAGFKTFAQLDEKTKQFLGDRNVLLTEKIDYDYPAEIAKAKGNVELVFYPEVEPGQEKSPAILNAKKGAEFAVLQDQAQFYGNVTGTLVDRKESYEETNVFYGDKLTVDLLSKSGTEITPSSQTGIKHIAITGPGVRLESIKSAGDTPISKVRLVSNRIDYNKATEEIIATGKGRIEYNSKVARSSKGKRSSMGTDKPCYALVEGFDKLIWQREAKHVTAYSDETNGVHIGYLPIENGRRGRKVTVDTRQIDIDYSESASKRAVLEKLTAIGGVVYYEEGMYEFAGSDLTYNARDDFMVVNGSDEMPCMFNGGFVDGVQYDLVTGRAEAVLSPGVGIIPVRE